MSQCFTKGVLISARRWQPNDKYLTLAVTCVTWKPTLWPPTSEKDPYEDCNLTLSERKLRPEKWTSISISRRNSSPCPTHTRTTTTGMPLRCCERDNRDKPLSNWKVIYVGAQKRWFTILSLVILSKMIHNYERADKASVSEWVSESLCARAWVCVCVCVCVPICVRGEREREKDRDKERERDRERDRDRDREAETETKRQRETQEETDRERQKQTDRERGRQSIWEQRRGREREREREVCKSILWND